MDAADLPLTAVPYREGLAAFVGSHAWTVEECAALADALAQASADGDPLALVADAHPGLGASLAAATEGWGTEHVRLLLAVVSAFFPAVVGPALAEGRGLDEAEVRRLVEAFAAPD